MTLKKRTRVSDDPDLQAAEKAANKKPLKKISFEIPIDDYHCFKMLVLKKKQTITKVLREFIGNYK